MGDVATNVARPVLGVGEVVAEAMAPPGVAIALKALKALLEVCEQYKACIKAMTLSTTR